MFSKRTRGPLVLSLILIAPSAVGSLNLQVSLE